MQLFKPTTLLDKLFELGIVFKGIGGVLELIGGVLLLAVHPATVLHITDYITQTELSEDPHDFLASRALHVGSQLAHGHNVFAAVFLLTHGAVKVGLVTALMLNKLWAYPVGLVGLSLLLAYQVYQIVVSPSLGIILLSILDVAIIWLVWREWQHVRANKHSDIPPG